MNVILYSPASSFWETDSSCLVLYTSPVHGQVHLLPTIPSISAGKLPLAPQPWVCSGCVQTLCVTVCGQRWFGAAWPTGETRRDYVSQLSVLLLKMPYRNMYTVMCWWEQDGFPGKEDERDWGFLTAACCCGSLGEGRSRVRHLAIPGMLRFVRAAAQ